MVKLAILFGILICIQAYMSFSQVKNYQKNLAEMKGKGILGIGARKGRLSSGQIVLLCCDRKTQKIVECRIMGGITVFEKFKSRTDYKGLPLCEMRKVAIEEDLKINKRYRQKHPYDRKNPSKKNGALLQAVEAIENRLIKDEEQRMSELLGNY